jgi:hypothetical protein
MAVVQGSTSLAAEAVLACSYLSARVVFSTATMFPDIERGTYGAIEAETTVTIPGITDGIYT